MENNIFINEAFTDAINEYLKYKNTPDNKNFNSFLVVVIRSLITIYGELDIINPYQTKNESGLGGFNENLKKFGLNDNDLDNFKNLIQNYYQNQDNINEELKSCFTKIEKLLVDMFILKKSHILLNDDEINKFKNLLYFSEDSNEEKKELYEKLIINKDEIINYLNSKLFEQKHAFNLTEYKDIALSPDAYKIAGFNIVEVMNMNEQDIENVNNKVYHFFRIKDNDINKRKRLENAVEYYKKYGNILTSGNGFVDTLLLTSLIATGLMIVTIAIIRLMR